MALRHNKYTSSPGYVLEWTSQSCHRHVLSSVEELRSELLAGDCPGLDRLLVLPSPLDDTTIETLRAIVGVDAGFLEAHAEAKAYRPKTRWRGKGVRAWCWKFPHVGSGANRYAATLASNATVCSTSLWVASEIPILLLDGAVAVEQTSRPAPKLRHQDAATRRSTLQSSSPYGAVGQQYLHKSGKADGPRSLEDDIREALDGGGGVSTSVEEILGELVHERWIEFLGSMRLGEDQGDKTLWETMAALEHNIDEARYMARQGRELETASLAAWDDLVQRLHLRIKLRTSKPKLLPAPEAPPKDLNERSLDRIAYLGGVLLPVTVVAGILGIEGEYGPEGGHFWVFWVAGAVATVVALLVIYLDQLRSLEVWLEVGDVFNLMDEGGERDVVNDSEDNKYLVQRRRDGSRAKAWRRSELGWGGAVKKASGYYRWRGSPGMEFRRPELIADRIEVV